MKKLLPLFLIVLMALTYQSCTDRVVDAEEDMVTKVNLDSLIRRSKFYVSSAYSVKGTDTVDLAKTGIYADVSQKIFLEFAESNNMFFYSGTPVPKVDTLPATAKVFNVLYRIRLPTNLKYNYDESKKTFIVKSEGTSSYFQFIPDGREATLIQEESMLYDNYADAKKATNERLTFRYIDPSPASGPVTYTVIMKPLWFIGRVPNSISDWYYASF